MSGFFRAQVRLPRVGLQPEDDVINVWHFDSDQTFGEDADDVAGRLLTFYNAISGLLAPTLDGAITIKMYDMADAEPRVPGFVLNDTLGGLSPIGSDAYPNEIAICLSLVCSHPSGTIAARRRGRIYLGPFLSSVGDNDGPDVRVKTSTITAILDAAEDLATGPDAGDGRLAVYSPTTDLTGTLADSFNDVITLKVDNAFDIQRRRGARATVTTVRNL